MRFVLLLVLVACNHTIPPVRHAALPNGVATAIARWRVTSAAPLSDGRTAVAADYEGEGGTTERWMPRGTGQVVAALSAKGAVDWAVVAPSTRTYKHYIAPTPDGGTWILARTAGPFVEASRQALSPARVATKLTRVSQSGDVARRIDLAALDVPDDAFPVFVACAIDGDAIVVLGTQRIVIVARVRADGSARFVRRLERGYERPHAADLPVFGALHGDTLWLAGAGTSLTVETGQELAVEARALEPEGYQGPIVVGVAATTGAVRMFPLEPVFVAGGWRYPSGIAAVGDRLVLARSTPTGSTISLHDASTFEQQRESYHSPVEIDSLATAGEYVVATVHDRSGHGRITAVHVSLEAEHGVEPVATITALDDSLAQAKVVVGPHATTLVGTFWGKARVNGTTTLVATHGVQNLCDFELMFHAPGCEHVPWGVASAFVIRVTR
jgi:hypothetical protein